MARTFRDVAVALPSKVRGSEAEEEWQEVDWITWSVGELNIDSDANLVFRPSESSSGVKSKPLGALVRANEVSDDDRTLVVTTSEAIGRLYRFSFQSAGQAKDFFSWSKGVAKAAAASSDSAAIMGGEAARVAEAQLEADIRSHYVARLPLVFPGAELYGPDPNSDAPEVLLGRGAFVLLDPPEEQGNRVGVYELLFIGLDEGVKKPVQSFPVDGKLKGSQPEVKVEDEDSPAASFELVHRGRVYTLSFDRLPVAATFSRDYRVRQKVMALAVKNVRGTHSMAELQTQIEGLQETGLIMWMFRMMRRFVILLAIAYMVQIAMLYKEDKSRPVADYMQVLQRDTAVAINMLRNAHVRVSSKVCELFAGALPVTDVRLCLGLQQGRDSRSMQQALQCIELLAGESI